MKPLTPGIRSTLRIAGFGAAGLGIALICMGGPWLAATQYVAERFSSDGSVSEENLTILRVLLFSLGTVTVGVGALLLCMLDERRRAGLDRILGYDVFGRRGLEVPGAYLTLTFSSMAGIAIVLMWWIKRWLPWVESLFANEGPLELLTFILEIAAAGCLVYASLRFRASPEAADRWIARGFAACAVALFFIGMEEINWGQTLLGFRTPEGWAAINYQQQTSLHNLIDRETLGTAARVAAFLLVAGSVALIGLSMIAPGSVLGGLAPTPALGGLLLVILYSGSSLHAEVTELLLATFFAFYGYRGFVVARSLGAATARNRTETALPPGGRA